MKVSRGDGDTYVERAAPPGELVYSAGDPAGVARLGCEHARRGGEVILVTDVLRGASVCRHACIVSAYVSKRQARVYAG